MTIDREKFKKEMEASQYFMNKNAKSMFDVIDMCKYYKSEEKAVRQTNSEKEEGSFVKLLNQEMEELTKSMKKVKKRYLDCKYLDAGMDGMLCSKSLCTTCKEFNGEKCKDYISKNQSKEKRCEYCKDYTLEGLPIISNCDPLFERFDAQISDMGNGGKEIVITTKGNAFGLPINYCPICGRKLK